MSQTNWSREGPPPQVPVWQWVPAEMCPHAGGYAPPEPPSPPPLPRQVVPRVRWGLPLFLFIATCFSTFWAGFSQGGRLDHGLIYSACVMTILVCHEGGHFLQALRHRVPASLPFFIPFPFGPIGTFGAVIAMSSHVKNRRALMDIGLSGPLAGLVPTLIFCVLGLQWSYVGPILPGVTRFGEPLLFKWLYRLEFGPIPPGYDVYLHPMAWAGWVGLFVTSLNLLPIGQLDGGHILYALMPRRANTIATMFLAAGALATIVFWWWLPMLLLLLLLGTRHPPTADDTVRLGLLRTFLGWLALAFVVIGFTPRPVILEDTGPRPRQDIPPEFRRAPAPFPDWPEEEPAETILV
ncbi:MAG: site-2 protease family protein [Thermoguttaceae bacterium]|nr:site-2 protease family protein [Thermoguttaceae bacterium]MDW8077850.1 site-2 protease family protein [Thermoguttaceae bacterium]